ncbi:lysophospholipid acyltransferase family protein [candidate division KSB1 bacterium]|nr:lysophospholipid acyltransferase family protein [candidate division KSB1 bacterium]
MIKAEISPLHEALFKRYIRSLLKKHFNAIRLLGDKPDFGDRPILLLPNHSTWWDGFFIHILKIQVLKRPGYLMMLEEQLAKNRFFANVGAYSINPTSAKENIRSLNYSVELLERPDHPFVCIFPQGVLSPWGVRPLGYRRGIDIILRKLSKPVNLCQLAMKCEYLAGQRADVFFQFGKNSVFEPGNVVDVQELEQSHEHLLHEMNLRIIGGEKGRLILAGKRSINESFEILRKKLGLLRGQK